VEPHFGIPAAPGRLWRSPLGCLGSCTGSLVGQVPVGGLVWLGIMAVFAPWGYYLGGSFHPYPVWTGQGTLQADSGAYQIFVTLYPGTRSTLGFATLDGLGVVCDPAGERFRMQLFGYIEDKHTPLDTDGEPVYLKLYYRPPLASMVSPERRPRIEFHGNWRNPNLVLDDGGTIGSAFSADGRAYFGPPPAASRRWGRSFPSLWHPTD
jgi:hypothetical protein